MSAQHFNEAYKENLASIDKKFKLMLDMVGLAAEHAINGLIIDGAPGIGKSFSIADFLKENYIKNHPNPIVPTWSSGHITPLQTFNLLGEHNTVSDLLVFDDCDGVFQEQTSMNVLKAATEMRAKRVVSWNTAFRGAKFESYQFDSSIIIITNASCNSVHFKALTDRFHMVSMDVTNMEKLAKIFSVATQNDYCDTQTGFEIAYWLYQEKDNIDYMSIRTFVKIAQLAKHRPETWRDLAQMTIIDPMKKSAAASASNIKNIGRK
jgi:hypothetical protein